MRRFYLGILWTPRVGDRFLMNDGTRYVYEVVFVDNNLTKTRCTEGSSFVTEWCTDKFPANDQMIWIEPKVIGR